MNELTEEQFQTKLQQQEKKMQFKNSIRLVLEMLTNVCTDLFQNTVNTRCTIDGVMQLIRNVNQVKDYANTEMRKIGNNYKMKTPYITEIWQFTE